MSNFTVLFNKTLDLFLRLFFCTASFFFIFFTLMFPLMTNKSALFVILFVSIPLSIFSFISLWQICFKQFKFFSKNGISRTSSFVIYILLIIYLWLAAGFITKCIKYRYSFSRVAYSAAAILNAVNNIQLRSVPSEGLVWKSKLLRNYLCLKFNESIIPSRMDEQGLLRENVFGSNFYFINYQDLLHSFNELFIHRTYYFDCNKPNPKIIDCGSNIGLSVLYFKMLYPESNILAFEPDGLSYLALEKNVAAQDLKNVKVINAALSLKNGEIKFFKRKAGSTMNSILRQWEGNAFDIVKTLKLSSFINEEIDLLKIDVEGAERLILKELDSADKLRFVNKIIMEFHHHIEDNIDDFSTVLKILEDNNFGYQISALERPPFKGGEIQYMIVSAYKKSF